MSNGISEMFERFEEESRVARLNAFNKHSDNDKIRSVSNALQALENFKNCSPRLSEHEWNYINDALYELRELLD